VVFFLVALVLVAFFSMGLLQQSRTSSLLMATLPTRSTTTDKPQTSQTMGVPLVTPFFSAIFYLLFFKLSGGVRYDT
jgi:hypothetical protein